MKKGIVTVFLMMIAVVFGVGLRYYMQTGSLQTQKPADTSVINVSQPIVPQESTSGDESEKQPQESELLKEPIEQSQEHPSQTSLDNDWGIVLSAEDVSPDGMTLVCTQNGGSSTGELSTGPWYELEVLTDGKWKQAPIYAEVCWEDIAWVIPPDEVMQWEVNWTWIYGTLPSGDYRISKEIMDFRQSGDYDTCRSYAYFTIE